MDKEESEEDLTAFSHSLLEQKDAMEIHGERNTNIHSSIFFSMSSVAREKLVKRAFINVPKP